MGAAAIRFGVGTPGGPLAGAGLDEGASAHTLSQA
ncbi:MAG: hypothetical protein QOH19_2061, partial [Actinomycetota bacterium]|nr:hypothetical protein [Actinomycetota bacterium]